MTRRGEDGFSLIELLVAVAVLALAAVTLLESQSQAISMTSRVQAHTLAALVAENRVNLTLGQTDQPVPGTRTGRARQMGAEFDWRETVRTIPGSDLLLVEVQVTSADGRAELARLTAFRQGR